MLSIQIPNPFLPGFKAIASMSVKQMDELVIFLGQIPIGTGGISFGKLFDAKFTKLGGSNVSDTIFSLATFSPINTGNLTNEEIAQTLKNQYAEQEEEKNQKFLSLLQKNLICILNNLQNLRSTIKAFELQSENSKTFKECRVVTDIRLLFNDDIGTVERNAVLVHRLKVKTEENNEEKEYFFSMDTADLIRLREQLERAERKDSLIKEQYSSSMNFISINE